MSRHHRDIPAAPLFAASLRAALAEDCGPCAMTAAQWALVDKVPRETINKALAGGGELDGEEALAFRFGEAIATQSDEALALGDQLEEIHGATVRLELAASAAMVRSYPAMKRGLGLSRACSTMKLAV